MPKVVVPKETPTFLNKSSVFFFADFLKKSLALVLFSKDGRVIANIQIFFFGLRLISKFLTSKPRKKTIRMHKLSKISRSKRQSNPFLKSQNWVYLLTNNLKFYTACFSCMPNLSKYAKSYRNILKLSCRLLACTSYIAFEKKKKESGTSLPVSSSALFLKRNISLVISYKRAFNMK